MAEIKRVQDTFVNRLNRTLENLLACERNVIEAIDTLLSERLAEDIRWELREQLSRRQIVCRELEELIQQLQVASPEEALTFANSLTRKRRSNDTVGGYSALHLLDRYSGEDVELAYGRAAKWSSMLGLKQLGRRLSLIADKRRGLDLYLSEVTERLRAPEVFDAPAGMPPVEQIPPAQDISRTGRLFAAA